MTIKLLLLKSGEDLISDVKEFSVEDRTVGYLLDTPYIVKILDGDVTEETENSLAKEVSVTFYPYIPLSDQKEILIPSDWVVTIVDPVRQVREMYEERINAKIKNGKQSNDNKTNSIDEQPSFNQSN